MAESSKDSSKRIFPSMPAAVVAGALVMPLFMLGCRLIETTLHSQVLAFVWGVVAFIVPLLLVTADLKYAARRRRELGGFFRPLNTPEDYRLYYIPAWKRLIVWFISVVVSSLILKAVGVEF